MNEVFTLSKCVKFVTWKIQTISCWVRTTATLSSKWISQRKLSPVISYWSKVVFYNFSKISLYSMYWTNRTIDELSDMFDWSIPIYDWLLIEQIKHIWNRFGKLLFLAWWKISVNLTMRSIDHLDYANNHIRTKINMHCE